MHFFMNSIYAKGIVLTYGDVKFHYGVVQNLH